MVRRSALLWVFASCSTAVAWRRKSWGSSAMSSWTEASIPPDRYTWEASCATACDSAAKARRVTSTLPLAASRVRLMRSSRTSAPLYCSAAISAFVSSAASSASTSAMVLRGSATAVGATHMTPATATIVSVAAVQRRSRTRVSSDTQSSSPKAAYRVS